MRSLRCAKGWTQQEAAHKAGFSDRLIRKAEAGEAIDLQSIALLVQLYSCVDTKLTLKGLLDEPLDEPATRCDATQVENVVRTWYRELWNNARLEIIDELVSPDCLLHTRGIALRGHSAIREHMQAIHTAFGDLALAIDELVIDDETAMVRWHATALHRGSRLGELPSGQRTEIYGSSWITLKAGQIQEVWQLFDGPHLCPLAAKNIES